MPSHRGTSKVIDRPPPPTAGEGDDGDDGCPWWPWHLPVVVYRRRWRDWFRKRYVVRCWTCELELGPFVVWAWAMANAERQDVEAADA